MRTIRCCAASLIFATFSTLYDLLNELFEKNSQVSSQPVVHISRVNFLGPFLDVIKSEATDGPVTARALAAVDKFINYGFLNANSSKLTGSVHSIAEAITKAKFMGTSDNRNDECVLLEILKVFYLTDH